MPSKKPIKDKVDKRYRAKVTVGHDADGEPIIKYASGRTKREMEENKAEIRRVYREGVEDANLNVTFAAYAKEWLEVYKLPGLGKSSQDLYANALNNHLVPVFGDRQLRAIRTANLDRFMNDQAHLSKTSVTYIRTILKNVFKRACSEGVIARDPAIGLKNTGRKPIEKRALTDAEAAAVLKLIESNIENPGRLLAVLYYTGLRRGEALGLQWRDVNFSDRTISVLRDVDFKENDIGELKTESSNREVPMPDELYEYLNRIRGIGETHIILSAKKKGFMLQSAFVDLWERTLGMLLELDDSIECKTMERNRTITTKDKQGKKKKVKKSYEVILPVITPHYFRHNYASLLYNEGVDILTAQRYLGHADIKTTLGIYAHLGKGKELLEAEKVKDAFKKVAKRLPEQKITTAPQKQKHPNVKR